MTITNIALIAFLVMQLVLVIALVYDGWLYFKGRTTISQYVWKRPSMGVAIIVGTLCMIGALAVHLFTPG